MASTALALLDGVAATTHPLLYGSRLADGLPPGSPSSSTSVLVTIALGSLTGGVAKGITGFGSAILLVLVWLVADLLGFDGGPLPLAIVSDCVSTVVTAVPLYIMMKAWRTADVRLVSSLIIFQTLCSPLGAFALLWFSKRTVELVMGWTLVFLVLAQTDALAVLRRVMTRSRSAGDRGPPSPLKTPLLSEDNADVVVPVAGGADDPDATAVVVMVQAPTAQDSAAAPTAPSAAEESHACSLQPDAEVPDLGNDPSSQTCCASVCGCVGGAEGCRVLGLSAIAGAISGVCQGLTGMSGPPVMYLFSLLKTPKEIARGVAGTLNLFQFRLVFYVMLGVFRKEDAMVYVVGATAHSIGILFGALVLNQHVSQRAFTSILTSLMVGCCVLLFTAAAGVTGG